MFGPPQDSKVLRPFGFASVDGFDFDFEGPNTNSVVFANQLRKVMDEYTHSAPAPHKGKMFFLSAAPQCPYPEVWMGDLLNGVSLDFVMVQFYNNWCGGKSSLLIYHLKMIEAWMCQC
jgi:chitinase